MKEQEVMEEEEKEEMEQDVQKKDDKQVEYSESYFNTGNFSQEQPVSQHTTIPDRTMVYSYYRARLEMEWL